MEDADESRELWQSFVSWCNESLILARTVDFERRGYFIIIFAFVNISGGCPSLVVKGGGS